MKIEIKGLSCHYQLIGSGKEVLVLLHGWGQDWQCFSPVIEELSKRWQLLLPDLPCFGQSDCPAQPWDSPRYASWLDQLLEKLIKGKKFSLLGHSFGGKIAALYAATADRRPDRLILVDAAGLPAILKPKQKIWQSLSRQLPDVLKQSLPLSLKRQFLRRLGLADDHLLSTPQQRLIIQKIVREDISETLPRIKTDSLIIWGENDQETSLTQARQFKNLLPQSQLAIIENAGHFPFIDQTNRFLEIVDKFLVKSKA